MSRPQTVADHSFRVAVIAWHLANLIGLTNVDFTQMIIWALAHDGPESKTSDLPAPAKELLGRDRWEAMERLACPWLQSVKPSSDIVLIVELADALEALSWIRVYGNGFKDKFDGANIDDKLTNRIRSILETGVINYDWNGQTIWSLIEEVAP